MGPEKVNLIACALDAGRLKLSNAAPKNTVGAELSRLRQMPLKYVRTTMFSLFYRIFDPIDFRFCAAN